MYQLVNYIKETHRNERQEDIKHWIEFHGIDVGIISILQLIINNSYN
jgi:cytidylate kinase